MLEQFDYNKKLDEFKKLLNEIKTSGEFIGILDEIESHLTSIGKFELIKAEKLLVLVRGIREQAQTTGFTQDEYIEIKEKLLNELILAKSIRKGTRFV